MNNLEEELAGTRIEDENGSVDGFRRQVALERLVDRHAVDVRVVDEPNDLIGEEFAVVLRRQVRLRRLRRVELKAFADTFSQDVESRIGFHDFGHGLLDERLGSREPVSVSAVQVVGQIEGDEDTGRRRVDRHVVRGVIEELGAGVAFDVVGIVVAPTQLDVDPVLLSGRVVHHIARVGQQGRAGHVPLVRGEEEDVGAGRVHLVRFTRMDRFLLHRFRRPSSSPSAWIMSLR